VRWVGHELHADADVAIPGALALDDSSEILDAARQRLTSRIPRLTEVALYATPASNPELQHT
jgi:divalent metal cation (Fe/Co/Zn/Cd) transporter